MIEQIDQIMDALLDRDLIVSIASLYHKLTALISGCFFPRTSSLEQILAAQLIE